jgi:hypothetical protein
MAIANLGIEQIISQAIGGVLKYVSMATLFTIKAHIICVIWTSVMQDATGFTTLAETGT